MHLAYRIIDVMGGHMEISSFPNRGTIVRIEIPVLRKSPFMVPAAPSTPLSTAGRRIAIVGFDTSNEGTKLLGEMLKRQYALLGAEICSLAEAELVVANGDAEKDLPAEEVIFLVAPDHLPPATLARSSKYRWIAKPVTPSVLRQSLRPRDPPHASPSLDRRSSTVGIHTRNPSVEERPKVESTTSTLARAWKPNTMLPEEAIACLSLGDYVSSRRRAIPRTPSMSSLGMSQEGETTPATSASGFLDTPLSKETETESEAPYQPMKVLVVEDNMINRKILVRILSTKLVSSS